MLLFNYISEIDEHFSHFGHREYTILPILEPTLFKLYILSVAKELLQFY